MYDILSSRYYYLISNMKYWESYLYNEKKIIIINILIYSLFFYMMNTVNVNESIIIFEFSWDTM